MRNNSGRALLLSGTALVVVGGRCCCWWWPPGCVLLPSPVSLCGLFSSTTVSRPPRTLSASCARINRILAGDAARGAVATGGGGLGMLALVYV